MKLVNLENRLRLIVYVSEWTTHFTKEGMGLGTSLMSPSWLRWHKTYSSMVSGFSWTVLGFWLTLKRIRKGNNL